ncbi:pentatricopeptide repeat-containing protein At1g80270, mitochondrial [Zea mays]|uniref:Pentatricopeptide repeat-containing protein mitochondrial n=3 Tax=Zea mays TaxID=4577 RepID=A0A1D6HW27_MAIZE|nr:pentatricopeptide repeat-containing protein At1g80270, mitochondrial [Zea mays]XP_020396898.1 pentatricopeptide repeat-containing protein At1g80270, mitochondrial [Zea mays]ONM52432.1 Pentatricopeptide repeat-containing protein mitochondrial [Zea mays]ONM52434.1 Pentatricopeptide repeat-containing protein mitochondrial [Zea mays]|eukprot:XP_008652192.1 pentatricopeptide repeat-containing protein At1g80270, mitochondrial [Zea mays]
MLKTVSVRLSRDDSLRPCQALLSRYSETVVPLIRRFCSTPIKVEEVANIEADGKVSYLDAAALPCDNSDCRGEPSHGSRPWTKRLKHYGPSQKGNRNHHETKLPGSGRDGSSRKGSHPQKGKTKLPGSGRDGSSRKGSHHETKLADRDELIQKGSHHEKELADTPFKPFLFQIVLDTSMSSLMPVLDGWVKIGNRLERDKVNMVLFHLRKQRMYNKALKFVEWIERRKLLNFEERDYASHLDLIARNYGVEAAQKYIERVPEAFRSEVLYETLLVNCVCRDDAQKAEQVFNEIRELSLPLTISACNQMLLLYKRVSRNKVVDILTLMEKENIKYSIFTYKLMIDLKVRSNDILGMEQVLNSMKENGLEPNFTIQTMVAKFYISGCFTEKAEEVINAMEVHVKANRHAVRSLLDLYAILGRPVDVERVWNLCAEPKLEDFLAAIKAWSKLGHIERAEEIFDVLVKTFPKLTSKYFNAMLEVYAENKLLDKSKKFIERMCLDGCTIGPLTWDAVVKLYVNLGELSKADSFLMNVTEDNPDRHPLFSSYVILLKAYAEKGDIHNAEKIFDRVKQTNFPARTLPYNLLLAAYASAQVTPYGFRERMKADKFSPGKSQIEQLKQLDSL